MLIVSAVNLALGTAEWYYVVISVIWCPALQFAIDGTLAFLINKMPDRWFGVDNALYAVSDAEKKLYKKLRVKFWKDRVWELGGLGGFSKKHCTDPSNPEYIERFIIECNKGVLTHRLSYPAGFLAMLTLSGLPVFTVALPIAIVNVYLNILPTLVLRYNTPKLQLILKGLKKRLAGTAVN